jgi:hypothetical protein
MGIPFVRPAVFDEVIPHLLAHRQVFRVLRVLVKVISRFDDLRP